MGPDTKLATLPVCSSRLVPAPDRWQSRGQWRSSSNYPTWKVQCRMALVKDGLWSIVNGTEAIPDEGDADARAKFVARRDRALALIVLSVERSLLYFLGDPEDPVVVWKKLSDQFQKKTWANKL